jgi:ribosome-binding factor A
MAKEYSRTERVGDMLQRELASLIQTEMRDPRVAMVNITGAQVSRDLSHARVFFTVLDADTADSAKPTTAVLNKAAGFLRAHIAKESTMRTVPTLRFVFDESVGRGRHLEGLIRRAKAADQALSGSYSDSSEE